MVSSCLSPPLTRRAAAARGSLFRRGALGALAILISCSPLPVRLGTSVQPVQALRARQGPDGAFLAMMPAAVGLDVVELPSGDIAFAGVAQTGFVQRISTSRRVAWTFYAQMRCGVIRLASGDDDSTYVSVGGLVRAAMTELPAPSEVPRCGPLLNEPTSTAVFRVDRDGRIAWRVDVTGSVTTLLPAAGGVVAIGQTDLVSLDRVQVAHVTARGEVDWLKVVPGMMPAASAPAAGIVWVATGSTPTRADPVEASCQLYAFDAASGAERSRLAMTFGAVPRAASCYPTQVARSYPAILWSVSDAQARGHDVLTGFDDRGTVQWESEPDLEHPSAGAGLPRRSGAPLLTGRVKYEVWDSWGFGDNPAVVGVDRGTGAPFVFQALRADLTENGPLNPGVRAALHGISVGRDALLMVGEFRGRLAVDGMHVDSPSVVRPVCPIAPAEVAAPGAIGCPRPPEEVREYERSLFLLRIPLPP